MGRAHHRRPVSLGGGARAERLPAGAADATPERLRDARLQGGDIGVFEGARRLADPLDTLRSRRKLDPDSPATNDLLWQAGDRFRRHWQGGRLDGLAALDLSRERVDGGTAPGGASVSETAVRHRDAYARASGVVGHRLLPYLTGVAVEGRPAMALVHLVSVTAHSRTAEALVVERLREALHRLVDHWALSGRGAGDTRRSPVKGGR